MLCLEPEAASIEWLQAQRAAQRDVPQGTALVVLDLGGGTCDATSQVVGEKPQGRGGGVRTTWQLGEVVAPEGEACGSKAVDREFEEAFVAALLRRCGVGEEGVLRFAGSAAMADALRQWVERKLDFDPAAQRDYATVLRLSDVATEVSAATGEETTVARMVERWNAAEPRPEHHLQRDGAPRACRRERGRQTDRDRDRDRVRVRERII